MVLAIANSFVGKISGWSLVSSPSDVILIGCKVLKIFTNGTGSEKARLFLEWEVSKQ
jgi:hypothetical protein